MHVHQKGRLTLSGCQETLVTEESCLFLISLLTHLQI